MPEELKILKQLAIKIKNKSSLIRFKTAEKLSQINSLQVIDILIKSLEKETDFDVQEILLNALIKFKQLKVFAFLCKQLENEDFPFWSQQPVINALCKTQDKQIFSTLISYLKDKKKSLVNKSIVQEKMIEIIDKTSLHLLVELQDYLEKGFWWTKLNRQNFNNISDLIEMLSHPSAFVRKGAVYMLEEVDSPLVKPILIKTLINDSSEDVRFSANFALGRLSNSYLLPYLISILKENNKNVYYKLHSTKKLERFGGENIFALIEQMKLDDENLQEHTADILFQITSSEIRSILSSIFKNSKPKVQKMVLDVLGAEGDPESLPLLKKALQDKSLEIRTKAAIYLSKQEKFIKALDTKEKKLLIKILIFALTKNIFLEDVISVLLKTEYLLIDELNFSEIQMVYSILVGLLKKDIENIQQNAINILEKIELKYKYSNEEFVFYLVKLIKKSSNLNVLAAKSLLSISPSKKILANKELIYDLVETLANPEINSLTYQILEKTIHSDIVPNLLRKAIYENNTSAIKSLKEIIPSSEIIDIEKDINWLGNFAKKYNEMHRKVVLDLNQYKRKLKLQEQKQEVKEEIKDSSKTLNDLSVKDQKISNLAIKSPENIKLKDLPALIEALKTEDKSLSSAIMKIFETFKSHKIKPVLIKALEHNEKRVRLEVLTFLLSLYKNNILQIMPKILEVLIKDNALANYRLFLEKIADKQPTQKLIELLGHNDVNMRKWAIESLGARRSIKAVSALVENLKDSDPSICACAALALGKIANLKAIPALIEALKNPNYDIKKYSAYALNEITRFKKITNLSLISAIQTALIDILAEKNEEISIHAAIILGRIGNHKAVPILIKSLTSPVAYLRAKSAKALGRIASNQAITFLINLLEDDFDYVCVSSIEALGQIADKQTAPILIEKLNSNQPAIKPSIIRAFGKIKSPETLEFLIEATQSANEDIRQAAAFSLGEIGNTKFLPILIEMTKDFEIKVQKEAIEALGKIETPEAIQALINLSDNIEVNPYMRQIAKDILEAKKV